MQFRNKNFSKLAATLLATHRSLPIVHHPAYEAAQFPPKHRFPMAKFRLLPEVLMQLGLAAPGTFHVPEPAPRDALLGAHDAAYVDAVSGGAVPRIIEREIGLPMQESVGLRGAYATGGTMLTAELALDHGIACQTAGGSHHARREHGAGFCVYNDVAVAAQQLLNYGRAGLVWIFDCDVHQGDGTARIFAAEPRVKTVSLHGANNYPPVKAISDLDVELPDGAADERYGETLGSVLENLSAQPMPDFVFYNAGVDPHHDDVLGRLSLTDAGLWERDRRVLDFFRQRSVPVACVIGGGYSRDIRSIAQRHAIIHQVADEFV